MNFSHRLVLIFIFVTACVIAGGIYLYFSQKAEVEETIEKQLMSAAQLKTGQIVNWRKDRLNDAYILMESPFLAESINEYIASPTAKLEIVLKFGSR